MATLTFDLTQQTSLYSQVEIVTPEVLISDFEQLPSDVYIRGDVDKSETTFQEYVADLSFPISGGKTLIKITEPLTYFEFTEVQITVLNLVNVQAGVKYILNGNNRRYTIKKLKEQEGSSKLVFADIPVQRLNVEDITVELLYKLQTTYNDTTRKHNTFSRITAIAKMYKRFVDSGMKPTDAAKRCEVSLNVSPAYISNAKLFLEEELTDEQIEDRKVLYDQIEKGLFSVDSGVKIIQSSEQLEISIAFIVDNLIKSHGLNLEEGVSKPISKNKVIAWINAYSKGLSKEPDVDTNKDNGSGNEEETNDSEKGNKKPKQEITSEVIAKADTDIKTVAPSLVAANTPSKLQEPDQAHIYQRLNSSVAEIAKILLNDDSLAIAPLLFEQFSKATLALLGDEKIYQSLSGDTRVSIAIKMQRIASETSKLFTAPKPEKEAVEDELEVSEDEFLTEDESEFISEDENADGFEFEDDEIEG